MSISLCGTNVLSYVKTPGLNNKNSGLYNESKVNLKQEKEKDLLRIIRTNDDASKNADNYAINGIVNDSRTYADSLASQRSSKQNTGLILKKMNYDFKGISVQIMRSKTSVNAKQVAGKARREVIRLKRQLASGEYDDDELRIAITHAQAMERVAKKKAKHLFEEEMVKVTGGACLGDMEEQTREASDEMSNEGFSEDLISEADAEIRNGLEEQLIEIGNGLEEQLSETRDGLEELLGEIGDGLEELLSETGDGLEELLSEIDDGMKEILEETGLEELTETVTMGKEMDPADYKMLKKKHRAEEMKAIAKADGEFLKETFNHYQEINILL
ncbi:MAG: hypothetical protein ACI4E1_11350 [Lachnospira sp.]